MDALIFPKERLWLLLGLLFVLTVCTTLRLPGLPVGVGELGLALTGLVSVFLLRRRILPALRQYRVLAGLWGIYLVSLAVAGGFSAVAGRLSAGWLHDVMAFCFAIGTAFLLLLLVGDSRRNMRHFALGFVGVALAFSCFAFLLVIVDYLIGKPVLSPAFLANGWWYGRFNAWAADPNQWALLLLVAGMLLVLLAERLRPVLLVLLLWLFLEVRSDAAVMGLLAFMLVYAGIVYYRQPALRRQALTVFMIFLAVFATFRLVADKLPPSPVLRAVGAVAGVAPTEKMLKKRKGMLEKGNRLFVGNGADKLNQRITLWGNSIKAWRHSPVVGLGPGAYSGVTRPLQNTESHNLYLQILVNTGVVGLLAALGFVIWLVRSLWRTPETAPWIAALAGLLVQGVGQYLMRHPVFWVLIVLLVWQAQHACGNGPAAADADTAAAAGA
ncbi:MAG: hypothetical protein K0S46_1500 [Moraxellaceae bacterium]|jgi:O-antigen ligase|nr:hypothetical protein [Moraxellaceae bacterium]